MKSVNKHIPQRMCAGCRNMFDKPSLIRVVLDDNSLIIDNGQKKLARGIYLCKNEECIKLSEKRRVFQNLLKNKVPDEFFEKLGEQIGR